MRRITLPEDLVKPSTVFNDYATPQECLDAHRHYASEIIRHRAWHATFNAAAGFSHSFRRHGQRGRTGRSSGLVRTRTLSSLTHVPEQCILGP